MNCSNNIAHKNKINNKMYNNKMNNNCQNFLMIMMKIIILKLNKEKHF